ncbi:MAG: biotin transporter BioY [Ignavibacteria bacterium]|nr:biotin transporter BioY [Ignavibacteria bacterium]
MEHTHSSTLSIAKHNATTLNIVFIVGFSLLTSIGAQIEIPTFPVPFTLQTFFVLLSGAVLGKRNGALSQLLYISLGIAGVPVFSGAGFGIAKILGPTGGYLLAFPFIAFLVGYAMERAQNFWWIFASMFTSMLVLFFIGTFHLYTFYLHRFSESVEKGFLLFSVWDMVKLFAASSIAHQLVRRKKTSQQTL